MIINFQVANVIPTVLDCVVVTAKAPKWLQLHCWTSVLSIIYGAPFAEQPSADHELVALFQETHSRESELISWLIIGILIVIDCYEVSEVYVLLMEDT